VTLNELTPRQPKAAPVAAKVPTTPAPVAAQTPAAPAPAPVSAATTTPAAPGTPTPAPSAQRSMNDPAMMMGTERQAALDNMVAMGFERAEAERAMRAAFYNPDRAVEYLINGIPAGAQQQQQQQQQAPAPPAAATATEDDAAMDDMMTELTEGGGQDEPVNLFEAAAAAGRGGAGARTAGAASGGQAGLDSIGGIGGGDETNLDFLRENPTFQNLRRLVQQQPQMLETVLQQVGASNPQLAQMINSNPEAFLQLLGEGADEEGVPLPPGAQNVSVTEEERDAIERLCRLGFERDMVIQAYFACDKNEELAANFLFDHPDDDPEA